MNIILGIINLIVVFTSVVLVEKFFKKEGLYIWLVFSIIVSNIIVCKSIEIFGIATTLGNVMFASNFLATDILTEKYGVSEAKKGIKMAFIFMLLFILLMQISLLFIPSSEDIVQGSMEKLFSINFRVSMASLLLFLISNNLDIFLYDKIAKKFPDKLWLRNNVATIVSNCCENYLFIFLAFIGIYNIPTIISIATMCSILEIIIALCDTPFLYLSKKIN